jgi:uncharacterized protein YprB with RNaseH-like and TPR domain
MDSSVTGPLYRVVRIENSFIPVHGVGETTEQRLWEQGITHWEAFDGDAVGDTTADRIAEFIDIARDHLDRGDPRFFRDAFPAGSHWRLYENFREDACFVDIETTGLSKHRNRVTVVGLHRGGDTRTLVRGRDLSAETLRRELRASKLLVTFNGKRFDVPFLEESFGIDIDLPHVDLMYPCRKIGLTGGLKTIESSVGIDRDRPDISGEDAVRLWREYEAGNEAALETLVSYNRDDAANLEDLMDLVSTRLHENLFEPARPGT